MRSPAFHEYRHTCGDRCRERPGHPPQLGAALLGQQDVPTVLSNTVVNGLFGALQSGCTECKPLPFPDQPPLLPSLAPAAGDAVTVFVGSLLSDSSVDQALGAFITDLVPGVLANQGFRTISRRRYLMRFRRCWVMA